METREIKEAKETKETKERYEEDALTDILGDLDDLIVRIEKTKNSPDYFSTYDWETLHFLSFALEGIYHECVTKLID